MNQIAVNARFYAHQPTGMQRYALEISRRFPDDLDPVRPAKALRGIIGHLWEQWYLPSAIGGRLLWSPNNTGPISVARQVCTIHDLAALEHPEWFRPQFVRWYSWLLPRLAERVQHIITVSEYTKQRVVQRLNVPAQKITVISNGVDERFRPRSTAETSTMRQVLGIGDVPYILCVGSIEPRKNLARLLEAWRRLQGSLPSEVELVVAGAALHPRIFAAVSTQSAPVRTRFTGYVPDEYLPALYSGALAFIYPSLYEGFGLPPLEALACGTPVITSNGTSLPEVVADSAVLVNPYDTSSIARAIWEVLTSPSLSRALSEKGQQRSRSFTWGRTATETLRVLLDQNKN